MLKEAYNNNDIDLLIIYLKKLIKKEIKLNNIFILKHKIKNEKQYINYIKSNIQAAIIYLNFLKDEMIIKENVLNCVIADLIPYIEELDKNEDLTFLFANTNVLSSSIHYKHVEELFYNRELRNDHKDHYNINILILYGIRLALEKRILGILGIRQIQKNNKPIIGTSKLLEIIKKLKNIEYNNIDWNLIIKINNWLNYYIHNQIRPESWIIHQVFIVLNNLFNSKQYKNICSIYGSTIINDMNKLDDEIKNKIYKKFGEEIKIIYDSVTTRELLEIK